MERWIDRANCIGVNQGIFFNEKGRAPYKQARKICGECPVVPECLDEAMAVNEKYGFRGGMSPRERRAYRRGKRSQA